MAHYLTEPIDVNDVGGGGGSTGVTQAEFSITANNQASEALSAYILRVYPSAIVANICNVSIINNGALAVTITSAAGTISLAAGATLSLGTGIRKINNLNTITLGTINSFTVMWSELDA